MQDLKAQIIAQLNLQDVKPEDIGDDQPLFVEGLGLDSIDALELIVLLQQQYKIKLSNVFHRHKEVGVHNGMFLWSCVMKI